jgi:DNA-binding Lrp family transcriptional regulator
MKPAGEENNDTTQLTDALTFLYQQKRTGKLLVSEQEKAGEIFLNDGQIRHAQFNQCSGLQALFFMLAREQGTYHFTPKDTIEKTTIEIETTNVLSLLSQRMQKWKRINKYQSLNLDVVFCLQPQARGSIRLKKEEWDILARIDGRKSLREISEELYLPPPDLIKTIHRFLEAGLIGEGIRYPDTAYADFGKDFLSALEHELNQVVGSEASRLLTKALQELDEEGGSLTSYRKMDILMEKISNAIPHDKDKTKFNKTALRILHTLASNERHPSDGEKKEPHDEKDIKRFLEETMTDLATAIRSWRKRRRIKE